MICIHTWKKRFISLLQWVIGSSISSSFKDIEKIVRWRVKKKHWEIMINHGPLSHQHYFQSTKTSYFLTIIYHRTFEVRIVLWLAITSINVPCRIVNYYPRPLSTRIFWSWTLLKRWPGMFRHQSILADGHRLKFDPVRTFNYFLCKYLTLIYFSSDIERSWWHSSSYVFRCLAERFAS